MNQKTLNIIYRIAMVVLIGVATYFVMGKRLGPIAQRSTPIQTKTPVSSLPPTSTSTSQNITSGWKTYQNQELSFKIQYPDDWVVVNSNVIGTIHQTQRKAIGYEIQNPGDENRIITIHDALISYYVENKSDYYAPVSYADTSTGNFVCHSPKEYFSPSQNGPVYFSVMEKSIEVCVSELVEDARYPFRPNIYIPIDNNKGLVVTGMYSSGSENAMEKFLQTFQQVVSTLEFVR